MNPIEKLTFIFSRFPGIGPRQAGRFVYFLLTRDDLFYKDFIKAIETVHLSITQCDECFSFSLNNDSKLCSVCASSATDKTTMLVVEKDADFKNISKNNVYRGRYFILGGTIPLTHEFAHEKIRLKQFVSEVIRAKKENNLKEIIFALSATPEGEHTTEYIEQLVNQLAIKHNIKITILGRGLSTGTELEYLDSETLKNAFKNRS